MQEVPLPLYTPQDEKIRQLEAKVNRLLQDHRIGASLMGPFPSADSVMGLRHAGNHYFESNTLNIRPLHGTQALTANYLFAVPFYVPNSPSIADRIALDVTTGAGGNVRLGIYDSDRNCYPRHLLVDAGTASTASTGVKAKTIRQGLTRGLKWLVVVSSGTATVIKVGTSGFWTPLGIDPSDWTYYPGWSVAFNYAALPALFPAGGSKCNWGPSLLLRFAV